MSRQIKAVLIGDTGVGKTAIYHALQGGDFFPDHQPTVGGDYRSIDLADGYAVGLWDTAGQEAYRIIIPMYFRDAAAIIVVFDVTSRDSYDHIQEWISTASSSAPEKAKIILLGNKVDITDRRVVELGEGEEIGDKIGAVVYLESSAKSGEGLEMLRAKLAEIAAKAFEDRQEPPPPEVILPTYIHVEEVEADKKDTQCC
jgi:small GTP-binding protein